MKLFFHISQRETSMESVAGATCCCFQPEEHSQLKSVVFTFFVHACVVSICTNYSTFHSRSRNCVLRNPSFSSEQYFISAAAQVTPRSADYIKLITFYELIMC